eukprot:gb/GECG01006875.1/.p1 GENE.gb/GECG01006875.1/~~gb/GECG01006875.1/.p1  ORF type:complete len:407 (+),score=57.47 gb/GECG01006875.1/:1-1221(+)
MMRNGYTQNSSSTYPNGTGTTGSEGDGDNGKMKPMPMTAPGFLQWNSQQLKVLAGGLCSVGILVSLLYMAGVGSTDRYTSGTGGGGLRSTRLQSIPEEMDIAIVTDLDHESKVPDAPKPRFKGYYKRGKLFYDRERNQYSVTWLPDLELRTQHSEAGRGMELSELALFNGHLYTCDDRSGIVFEIENYLSDQAKAIPRYILMEGDAETDKGFKCEWMTVKDNKLFVGSFGKEFTDNNNQIINTNNNWVKTIDKEGRVNHVDWNAKYNFLRGKMGYSFPAYLLHETAIWSNEMRKWVFLPRRMSKEAYDDKVDEKKGANTVILANEDFTDLQSFRVGTLTPERGFSSAKFVPGSRDQVLVALKSEENSDLENAGQSSYITVFDLQGNTLLEETQIPGAHKFEGIEFI